MKRVALGFLVVALFVPVGVRVWSWPSAETTQLDAAEVANGKELFSHVWTPNDPLAGGDGVGPVFNAASCVACHFQGGVGGSGGLKENVTTYRAFNVPGRDFNGRGNAITGILHAQASSPEFLETADMLDPQLPKTSQPTLEMLKNANGRGTAVFSQRNTPALFGARLIDEIPDREIIALARRQQIAAGMADAQSESLPVGRVLYGPDGRVGKFGWKGQTPSLLAFVQGACANELGLSNPNQPQPVSIAQPNYKAPAKEDLTLQQCRDMASFIASLPSPRQEIPEVPAARADVHRGQALFGTMGCATCHVPNVGSAQGIYSDLLLHRMGKELEAQGHYYAPSNEGDPSSTPQPDEWRTPPLWGVADSAPYLHDGRAATLIDAIRQHGGQAKFSVRRFNSASDAEREQVVSFLKSLKAPGAN